VVVDDAFWEKLGEKIGGKIGEALKPINEKLDRVDKRTGLLVEESARKLATRNFGDNFSRSFTCSPSSRFMTLSL